MPLPGNDLKPAGPCRPTTSLNMLGVCIRTPPPRILRTHAEPFVRLGGDPIIQTVSGGGAKRFNPLAPIDALADGMPRRRFPTSASGHRYPIGVFTREFGVLTPRHLPALDRQRGTTHVTNRDHPDHSARARSLLRVHRRDHVERHRGRMLEDARKDLEQATAALAEHARVLPGLRQAVLAARETAVVAASPISPLVGAASPRLRASWSRGRLGGCAPAARRDPRHQVRRGDRRPPRHGAGGDAFVTPGPGLGTSAARGTRESALVGDCRCDLTRILGTAGASPLTSPRRDHREGAVWLVGMKPPLTAEDTKGRGGLPPLHFVAVESEPALCLILAQTPNPGPRIRAATDRWRPLTSYRYC